MIDMIKKNPYYRKGVKDERRRIVKLLQSSLKVGPNHKNFQKVMDRFNELLSAIECEEEKSTKRGR